MEPFEYEDSTVDYRTGELIDTYTITVRRAANVDRIEALRDTLKFVDLNL